MCGIESTVLDGLRISPAVLRPGGVTFEQTASGPCVSRAVRGRIRLLMLLLAVLMLTPLIIMRLWNWYTDYFQIYTHRVVRMQHSLDPYPCAELKLSKPTDPASCPGIVRRHLFTPS